MGVVGVVGVMVVFKVKKYLNDVYNKSNFGKVNNLIEDKVFEDKFKDYYNGKKGVVIGVGIVGLVGGVVSKSVFVVLKLYVFNNVS